MDKKILIACPVSSRGWIIPYYLRNLRNLDYDKKSIDLYWIINNSTDNSHSLLKEFKKKYNDEYHSIEIEVYNSKKRFRDDRRMDIRTKYTYYWLSELRNRILKKCFDSGADYLLSSDCDVLFKGDLLKRLLYHNKDIVSSLLYNGYLVGRSDDEAYKYPNLLRKTASGQYEHIVNYKIKYPDKNPMGTLVTCDLTGACILISRAVCAEAKYDFHLQGEDEYFCTSAKRAGYDLWCDVSMYSQHVMSPDLLERYKDFQ